MESKFTKSTDEEHEIMLESSISYAMWTANRAYGGSEAAFTVKTAFVGEGSKIKITGKSDNGENLGKITDVILGNSYSGKLSIPDDIELGDNIYFEVELPQLGLSYESNHIPAGPPINATNMRWDKSEARRGDTLTLTADINGVHDGTEVKIIICEYDRDGFHDKIVEIPTTVNKNKVKLLWEYEYHEDTDEIPTQEELDKYGEQYNPPEYFFVIDIEGQRFGEMQESGLLEFKDWVEVTFNDEDGQPAEGIEIKFTYPNGEQNTQIVASDGKVKFVDVPPGKYAIEAEGYLISLT